MSHFETVMADPANHYGLPRHVLTDEKLSESEKRKVLQEWEQDALALERASEENMNADVPDMLSRIHRALQMLNNPS